MARHVEIGSCNRIFQLGHTYYELVANLDRSIPLLRDKMMPRFQCGDGMAIVSLTSDDLPGDRALIETIGLAPDPIINARRAVPMPDGSIDETNSHCFYVWRDERHRFLTLFLSHHYKPETIFVPAYQQHPNGALDVVSLTYVADRPEAQAEYFATMFGAEPTDTGPDFISFDTPRGERIEVMSPVMLADRYDNTAPWCDRLGGYAMAIAFAVTDLVQCRDWLRRKEIPCDWAANRLRVPATHAAGIAVDFVPRPT